MKAGKSAIASPLWVGFEGTSLPSEVSRWLAKGRIGGVVLYARNIESPAQVRALCRGIRSSAGRGNPLPLIAVDQEGGRVARFKEPPFTRFPPARACSLFCCRNETVAEAVGAATAAELRAVGIDIDFAPVLDVDSNPRNPVIGDRAFSDDPGAAATMGIAFAKGLLSRGILPVGKHFPGHGDTSADSHKELPVVRAGRETLLRRELLPFRRAARSGIPALMTAHVMYPALDRALPATLSRKILHDLLRERMRFRGTVFSDALEMKAIADRYGLGEAAVLAVAAGCDVVLVCRGESAQAEAIDRLARETRDRPTFRRTLAAAAVRSGRLRDWAASKERCRPAPRAVGAARHRRLSSLLREVWESTGRTSPADISGNIGEG
ncbi:MAG TPA: beta-N-acetylhexosaminidase [Deltaproteobacteria bacterium]|nr:beta-N-acetylhexosaminidase [Deltaproteobacteria bacterium]HBG73101.1 beta-N-acetylhexosaminidase [Deltaproteobacteria bacterium]